MSDEAAYQAAIEQAGAKIDLVYPPPRKTLSLEEEMAILDVPGPQPWFSIPDWGIAQFLGAAPPVDWLIEGILPRATPSVLCSLGGVGKSFLMLDLCAKIAAGPGMVPSYALGGAIPKRGRCVFITAEDSQDAIHRRLNQIVGSELDKAKLLDWLYIVPLPVVGNRPLMTCIHGEYKMTDAWRELVEELKQIPDLSLVVLDPMAAVVSADINSDPAAAAAFWSAVSELCQATGATVMLTHHMRKDGSRDVDGPMAARQLVRGSTAIVDSARWCYALWLPSASVRDSIEQATGETYDELSIVEGAVVKSNDIGMSPTRIYLRDPASGILIDSTERVQETLEEHRQLTEEEIMQTFGAVSNRWAEGQPFSHHAAAKDRYLGKWMCAHFDITKQAAKDYIQQWLGEGRLVKEPHPKIQRAQGLRFAP